MRRARVLVALLLGSSLSAFSCSSPTQAEHHRFVVIHADGMSVVLVERVLTTDHEGARSITSRTPAAAMAVSDAVIELDGGPAFDQASFVCRVDGDLARHTLEWKSGGLFLDDLRCDMGEGLLLVAKHGPGGSLVQDHGLVPTSEAEERAFLQFDAAPMTGLVRASLEARN